MKTVLNRAHFLILLCYLLSTGFPLCSYANNAHDAVHLIKLGKFKKAELILKQRILDYPHEPEAYNNLAVIWAKRGNLKQAQEWLEKAMQSHKGYAISFKNLQKINTHLALSEYQKTLNVTPNKKLTLTPAIKPAPPLTIQQTLQQWAKAQSTKNSPLYLSFYSSTYTGSESSHHQWVLSQTQRLNNTKTKNITFHNIRTSQMSASTVLVTLEQTDDLKNTETKQLIFINEQGQWKISHERIVQ